MNFETSTIPLNLLLCPFKSLDKSFITNTLGASDPYMLIPTAASIDFLARLIGLATCMTWHRERPSDTGNVRVTPGTSERSPFGKCFQWMAANAILAHSKGEYFLGVWILFCAILWEVSCHRIEWAYTANCSRWQGHVWRHSRVCPAWCSISWLALSPVLKWNLQVNSAIYKSASPWLVYNKITTSSYLGM